MLFVWSFLYTFLLGIWPTWYWDFFLLLWKTADQRGWRVRDTSTVKSHTAGGLEHIICPTLIILCCLANNVFRVTDTYYICFTQKGGRRSSIIVVARLPPIDPAYTDTHMGGKGSSHLAEGTCQWALSQDSRRCFVVTHINHLVSLFSNVLLQHLSDTVFLLKLMRFSKLKFFFWVGSFSYPLALGRGHSISWIDLHLNWTCSITHLLKLLCFTTVPHYLSSIPQQAFNLLFHIVLCFIKFQVLFIKINLVNIRPPPLFPIVYLF